MTTTKAHTTITGLIAATFTPFTADGEVDYTRIPPYVAYLQRCGVSGAFVNGSTGEGASLSVEERKKTAAVWVDAARGKLQQVIVHVGACSLPEAKELACHAVTIKASGVACVPPFYFKTVPLDGVVQFLVAVASCCPGLPFYYYHFPAMTAVSYTAHDVFKAAKDRIPNLAGMKFTSNDMKDACLVANLDAGKYQVFLGFDDLYLSGLSMGLGSGAIGALYNFMPQVARRLRDAFQRNDLVTARIEQERIHKVLVVNARYTTALICREFMEFIGLDVGPPRLPQTALSADKKAAMRRELEKLGFFKWIQ